MFVTDERKWRILWNTLIIHKSWLMSKGDHLGVYYTLPSHHEDSGDPIMGIHVYLQHMMLCHSRAHQRNVLIWSYHIQISDSQIKPE